MKTNKLIAEFPNQEKGKSDNYQSYRPEVFCKKLVSEIRNIHTKTPVPESLF